VLIQSIQSLRDAEMHFSDVIYRFGDTFCKGEPAGDGKIDSGV
jgi:hypothetical protein